MPELPTYFNDFLASIRLAPDQVGELKAAHTDLRQSLEQDPALSSILVDTFLQGSYRRATIVRPAAGDKADVDVIVVTCLDRHQNTPQQAQARFRVFLDDHYLGHWVYQGRSIGIELETVKLDLVITSAPSEVDQKALHLESVRSLATLEEAPDLRFNAFWLGPEKRAGLDAASLMRKARQEPEWKTEPLWIPDRDAREWQETDPLEQLRWTRDKNAHTGGHFVNAVKALKWWRRVQYPQATEPKSYPLERIFGECCPDQVGSVPIAITSTLETIGQRFRADAIAGKCPELPDPGTCQNVLRRLSDADFQAFYQQAESAATAARAALDEKEIARGAALWRQLFGDEFPDAPSDNQGERGGGSPVGSGGYSERRERSDPDTGRFA